MIMKKTLLFLAACLSLACFCSCNPEDQKENDGPVTTETPAYYLSSDLTETIVLAEGRSKSVKLNVKTNDIGSANNLTFTIKADMSLVADYNEANSTDCVAMPASCYSFDKTDLSVSRYGTSSTTGTLKITANELEQGKTYLLPVTIGSVTGGEYKLTETPNVYVLLQAAEEITEQPDVDITAGLVDDECKPADESKTPDYTINSLEDMKNLRNNLKSGATTYVVLNADVDMSSVTDWTPLFSAFNEDGTDLIEFNGKGHTISNFTCSAGSYRSFFGFLSGRVYDVTFENASVDGTADGGSQPCGIIAGYGGNKTGNSKCFIYDVNVSGEVTAKAGGVGGLVGVAVNAIVKRCSFDGSITNNGRRQGGIVGYHNVQVDGAFLRIEDCWSAGTISGTQQVAGILGQTQYDNGKNGLNTGASVIRNCYSTMTVEATRNAGGICGSCSYGGSYHDTELEITKDMVIGCIAWNDRIEATGTTTGNYSSASVVGYCNIYQYFQNCYRKSDMDFKCPVDQLADDGKTVAQEDAFSITPVDQENSAPDLSMLTGTALDDTCAYSYQYAYPYHGKAAEAGSTVSSLARQLKWNEAVWDLSGELPVLK